MSVIATGTVLGFDPVTGGARCIIPEIYGDQQIDCEPFRKYPGELAGVGEGMSVLVYISDNPRVPPRWFVASILSTPSYLANNLVLSNIYNDGQIQFWTRDNTGLSQPRIVIDTAAKQVQIQNGYDFHVYHSNNLNTLLHVGTGDEAQMTGENVNLQVGSAAGAKITAYSGFGVVFNASADIGATGSEAFLQGKGARVEIGNEAASKFRLTNTGFDKWTVDRDGFMFVGNGAEISSGLANTPMILRGLFASNFDFYASRFDGTSPAGSVKRGTIGVDGNQRMTFSTENLTDADATTSDFIFTRRGVERLRIMSSQIRAKSSDASIAIARIGSTAPFISAYDETYVIRYGYIQFTNSLLNIVSEAGDVVLNAAAGSQIRTSDALYSTTGSSRFFNSGGANISMLGTTNRAYLQFYPNATNVDTIGTRAGWIGFSNSVNLLISSELTNSDVILDPQKDIVFRPAGVERARFVSNALCIGKAAVDTTTEGAYISGNTGQYVDVMGTTSVANIFLNRINAGAIAVGQDYIDIRRAGVQIGAATIATTTTMTWATSSDKRRKQDFAPVPDEDAIEILMKVDPVYFAWRANPNVRVMGYLAQDVAEAWPMSLDMGVVVAGRDDPDPMKDKGWMMEHGKLMPVVHSSVRAHERRLNAMEERLRVLEEGGR